MLATIFQIAGLVVATCGIALFYVPAGLIAFGATLFYIGFELEKSK